MEEKKKNIVANFPNGFRLRRVTKGFQIVDVNYDSVADQHFGFARHLGKDVFEVGDLEGSKIGIFQVGKAVDWNADTPTKTYNKASRELEDAIRKAFASSSTDCFCGFPRVVDYVVNRYSRDARMVRRYFEKAFLKRTGYSQAPERQEHIMHNECLICGSEFQNRYKERSIDKLEIVNLKRSESAGGAVKKSVPTFLDSVHYREYKLKYNLAENHTYAASLEELLDYLFPGMTFEDDITPDLSASPDQPEGGSSGLAGDASEMSEPPAGDEIKPLPSPTSILEPVSDCLLIGNKNHAPTSQHESHHWYYVYIHPHARQFQLGQSIAGGHAERGGSIKMKPDELLDFEAWEEHFKLSGCEWGIPIVKNSKGDEGQLFVDMINGLKDSL